MFSKKISHKLVLGEAAYFYALGAKLFQNKSLGLPYSTFLFEYVVLMNKLLLYRYVNIMIDVVSLNIQCNVE